LYLVTQADIDKIDALIGVLNLAITEILEARPVRGPRAGGTAAQVEYDEQIAKILYRDDPRDPLWP